MFGVISVVAFREIMQGHLEAVGIEPDRRNVWDFFSAHFLADQLTLFQSKGSRLCPPHRLPRLLIFRRPFRLQQPQQLWIMPVALQVSFLYILRFSSKITCHHYKKNIIYLIRHEYEKQETCTDVPIIFAFQVYLCSWNKNWGPTWFSCVNLVILIRRNLQLKVCSIFSFN